MCSQCVRARVCVSPSTITSSTTPPSASYRFLSTVIHPFRVYYDESIESRPTSAHTHTCTCKDRSSDLDLENSFERSKLKILVSGKSVIFGNPVFDKHLTFFLFFFFSIYFCKCQYKLFCSVKTFGNNIRILVSCS